ncbi:MAG: hypothetical protein NVS4B3_01560 [Gemmatimonadaceae bacterium]
MRIEREMGCVKGDVVRDERPNALVMDATHRLQAAPKDAVVYEEKIGSGGDCPFDRAQRAVDGRGDLLDLAAVLDLDAV